MKHRGNLLARFPEDVPLDPQNQLADFDTSTSQLPRSSLKFYRLNATPLTNVRYRNTSLTDRFIATRIESRKSHEREKWRRTRYSGGNVEIASNCRSTDMAVGRAFLLVLSALYSFCCAACWRESRGGGNSGLSISEEYVVVALEKNGIANKVWNTLSEHQRRIAVQLMAEEHRAQVALSELD